MQPEETKESASNTNVRQLRKPSGFACIRVSQLPEFNEEIFTYSGENSITVFFEHIKDHNRYVRSILSDVKPMKTLTAEQQLQQAPATTYELCHPKFTNKNKKAKHHCHLSRLYISFYCNTCNWKLKCTKRCELSFDRRKDEESIKEEQTTFFNGTLRKFIKRAEDITIDNDDLDTNDHMMTEDSHMIQSHFTIFERLRLAFNHAVHHLRVRPQLDRCHTNLFRESSKLPDRQSTLPRDFAISHHLPRHSGPKFGCRWKG